MSDIVVAIPEKRGMRYLEEKKKRDSYWPMHRIPRQLTLEDKIFILLKGEILGFFLIDYIDIVEKRVYLKQWTNIKPIPADGSQYRNYRTRDFVYEEKKKND